MLPKIEFHNVRVFLIPALLILVLPFILYTPILQQKQLLDLLNQTVTTFRTLNESRHVK